MKSDDKGLLTAVTREDAQIIFSNLIEMLYCQGIPISPDIDPALKFCRTTRSGGHCRRLSAGEDHEFAIFISLYVMKDPETVRSVLAHELCHTIEGCFNHSALFRKMSRQITAVTGVKVYTRMTRAQSRESGIDDAAEDKARYQILCRKCGRSLGTRMRACKITGHPGAYRCRYCGGKIQIVDLKNKS